MFDARDTTLDRSGDDPARDADAAERSGAAAPGEPPHDLTWLIARSARWLRLEAYRNDRICHRRRYR